LQSSSGAAKSCVAADVVVIDDKLYYCMPCLQKVQKENNRNISDIKSYSLTSSTDSLRNHLITVHGIPRGVSLMTKNKLLLRLQALTDMFLGGARVRYQK